MLRMTENLQIAEATAGFGEFHVPERLPWPSALLVIFCLCVFLWAGVWLGAEWMLG